MYARRNIMTLEPNQKGALINEHHSRGMESTNTEPKILPVIGSSGIPKT
mgnify:CR=1 FL=1